MLSRIWRWCANPWVQLAICVLFATAAEIFLKLGAQATAILATLVVDWPDRTALGLGLVGNSRLSRQPFYLARGHSKTSPNDCVPGRKCRLRIRSLKLLDVSRGRNFTEALARHCARFGGTSDHRPTGRQTGGAAMTLFAALLILVTVSCFVAGQILLKHAMDIAAREPIPPFTRSGFSPPRSGLWRLIFLSTSACSSVST